jgi:tripartite ATP-independent transporter DctM subunit
MIFSAKQLNIWSRRLVALEKLLLSLLLSSMVLLATTQILLRNGFSSGISWADPALRLSVLWIAMLGAMAASREGHHIHIDVLSRYLPDRAKGISKFITDSFSALICAVLAWHAGYTQRPAATPAGTEHMSWLSLLLIILALMGAPLFVIISAGALLGFYQADIDLSVVAIEFFRIAEMPVLLAIPFFTFAGYLLSESNAPQRLVGLTRALLGWMPGGLAMVSLVACAFFTAFTGASGVTIVAIGALLYPALTQAGYKDNFSLGLVTTSGSLGLLFAPALPLILYAIIAQQMGLGEPISIDDMFLAGILPGLLMLGLLMLWSLWNSRGRKLNTFSWAEAGSALRESIWEIPLPFIVLGGIYSGYFAISEAAAVTALYVLIVEVFILREISLRQLPNVMHESMLLVGGILIILGASLASTNYLIDAEVPAHLFEMLHNLVSDKLTFLILLNLFLLLLGTMLDIFSALVLIVPLLLPVALGYGIDPVHLGIIFLANMQIGYFTPPVGMNLFIASYRFGKPVLQLYRATLPWFLILFAAVLIITYWPGLSLWLTGRG